MDSAYDTYYADRRELRCDVVLQNRDLWKQFHEIGTEMIITKSGRRMFPSLRIQIHGLEPMVRYCVMLEMAPRSDCRYKYNNGSGIAGWSRAGSAEPHSPHRVYLHPDSPATGAHWMAQTVNFNRLKLTNSAIPHPGHVVLSSMHKYQPRVIIIQAPDPRALPWAPSTSVSFPETQFIAVTAYQNDKITKLKIDNNPFAKGFRENGQSRFKRKRGQPQDDANNNQEFETTSKKSCTSSDESFTSSPEPSPIPQQVPDVYIPPPMTYQSSPSWYGYSCSTMYKCPVECPCPGYEQVPPAYYLPQVPQTWSTQSYSFSPYLPLPVAHHQVRAQDLSASNQKPKCLTDFSIRAIMES